MKKLFSLAVLTLALSACVSSGTQVVVGDQEYAMSRSGSERIEDFGIERMALQNISQIYGLEAGNHRVAVNSFRSDVLLTGEVPTAEIRDEIGRIVKSIRQVGQVYNYLKVGDSQGQSYALREQYLKRKIDAKLLLKQAQTIKPSQYLVVVRDNIAYVMGIMSVAQQEELVNTAKTVDGLGGVYLLNSQVKVVNDGTNTVTAPLNDAGVVYNPNNRLPISTATPVQAVVNGKIVTTTTIPASTQPVQSQPTQQPTQQPSIQQQPTQQQQAPATIQRTEPLSSDLSVYPNNLHNSSTPAPTPTDKVQTPASIAPQTPAPSENIQNNSLPNGVPMLEPLLTVETFDVKNNQIYSSQAQYTQTQYTQTQYNQTQYSQPAQQPIYEDVAGSGYAELYRYNLNP